MDDDDGDDDGDQGQACIVKCQSLKVKVSARGGGVVGEGRALANGQFGEDVQHMGTYGNAVCLLGQLHATDRPSFISSAKRARTQKQFDD